MKRHLLPLLALAATSVAHAAPRTLGQAQELALQFLGQQTGQTVELSQLNRRAMAPGINPSTSTQPFYAFNDMANNSFVIISGSDLMRPVIGYSTSGLLPDDESQMPDNLRSWFQWLGETAEYLEQHPEAALTPQQANQEVAPIAPLMGSKWGQDDPYDDLCPTGCPVGCVSTATSQVMRYHFAKNDVVVQGKGTHSYKYGSKTYSVDYSKNTYDYHKMPLSYRNVTDDERQELSKFCYHVSVGLDMKFAKEGSGALSCAIPRVAIEHFGFNSLTSYISRNTFSYDEWFGIMYNELQNERPIIYGGQSSEGGHAFVLEGIDQQGLFYVNWGWYGSYDGYFDITVLNSGGAGTGATVSEDGYHMLQDAVVNFCMEEGTGKYYTPMEIGEYSFYVNKSSLTLGGTLTVSAYGIQNFSAMEQKGHVGLLLMQGDELYDKYENNAVITVQACSQNSIYRTGQVDRKITFPKDLPSGQYQLWMYWQPQGKDYYDVLRAIHTRQSYFNVNVDGDDVTISSAKIEVPLQLVGWTWDKEQIETRPTTLTCELYNPSDESFVAQYLLTLIDPDGNKIKDINSGSVVIIGPGETKGVPFEYHFTKAGHWKAQIDLIRQNLSTKRETFEEADGEFEVKLNETQGSIFEMSKTLELVSDTVYLNRDATFRIYLKNTGAPYNGQMGIRFYQKSTSKTPTAEFFCDATFEADSEDYVDVTGLVTGLKEKTVYYARAAYLFGDDYEQFDAKPGTSNSLNVRIYPEPASGIEQVTVDNDVLNLNDAAIYNLLGKRIELPASGQLPRGIYIINGRKTIIKGEK